MVDEIMKISFSGIEEGDLNCNYIKINSLAKQVSDILKYKINLES